jgi:hypothetical protein
VKLNKAQTHALKIAWGRGEIPALDAWDIARICMSKRLSHADKRRLVWAKGRMINYHRVAALTELPAR